jgi:hypothetical protein
VEERENDVEGVELENHCTWSNNRGSLIVKFPDDPTILWKDENGWKVRGLSKVCFFTFNFRPFSYFCCKLI